MSIQKNIINYLAIFTLVVGLAACGGSSPETSQTASQEEVSVTTASEENDVSISLGNEEGEGVVINSQEISVGGDQGVNLKDGEISIGGDDGVSVKEDGSINIGGKDGITVDQDSITVEQTPKQ